MTISQQTTSLLDTTREAGLDEYAEAVLTVQDASQSLQRDPRTGRNGIKEDIAEMILPFQDTHRQFAYPAWPTSKPGPQETLPLPGQKPHPTRTDQMIYECYDQEWACLVFLLQCKSCRRTEPERIFLVPISRKWHLRRYKP